MDPNVALQSLLCGHMVFDHTEALEGWLRGRGFEPNICRPVDVHPFFADMPFGDVTADSQGVWSAEEHPSGSDVTVKEIGWTWREIHAAIRSGALTDSEV